MTKYFFDVVIEYFMDKGYVLNMHERNEIILKIKNKKQST